jgi:hypothetical protein
MLLSDSKRIIHYEFSSECDFLLLVPFFFKYSSIQHNFLPTLAINMSIFLTEMKQTNNFFINDI